MRNISTTFAASGALLLSACVAPDATGVASAQRQDAQNILGCFDENPDNAARNYCPAVSLSFGSFAAQGGGWKNGSLEITLGENFRPVPARKGSALTGRIRRQGDQVFFTLDK